jgi:hypothetical protein
MKNIKNLSPIVLVILALVAYVYVWPMVKPKLPFVGAGA